VNCIDLLTTAVLDGRTSLTEIAAGLGPEAAVRIAREISDRVDRWGVPEIFAPAAAPYAPRIED
jgi:hypothetical protein